MARSLQAEITLNSSGYIASMQKIIKSNEQFQNQIKENRQRLEQTAKQKYEAKLHLDNRRAIFEVKETQRRLKELQKQKAIVIAAKDMARDKIRSIKSTLREITDKPKNVTLKAIDKTRSVISSIKNSIFNLKTLAAGIVFGAATKAAFDNTIGAGSRLEQEEVSMKHFIAYQNKGKKGFDVEKVTEQYIEQLRNNANITPFGTNEVISAGRRAINIMQGNVQQSMGLVELAENMASVNPGKTIMDSMEALADLKTGEFERMEFCPLAA